MLNAQEAVNWHWLQFAKTKLQGIKRNKTAGKDLEANADSSPASIRVDEPSTTSDHSELEWRVRGPMTPRAKDLRSRKVDKKYPKQPSQRTVPDPSATNKAPLQPNARSNVFSNFFKLFTGK